MIAVLLISAAMAAGGDVDSAKVKGTPVQSQDAKSPETSAMIGKKGYSAIFAGKMDQICAAGRTVVARFDRPDSFEVDAKKRTLDALIDEIARDADAIACLRISGDRPAKAQIDTLNTTIVKGKGISLFLPESPPSH